MDERHDDEELERMESDPEYDGKWSRVGIVRQSIKVMNIIRNVLNETELRKWRSLNFEKLKGRRAHQYSLKINDQWRLITEIEERQGANRNCMVTKGIEDYH